MKRRKFIYQATIGLGSLLPVIKKAKAFAVNNGPFLATGIKIGEVTASSAIIWSRLTTTLKPIGKDAKVPDFLYLDESVNEWHPVNYFKEKYKEDRPNRKVKVIFPDGYSVDNIEGAVPGSYGETRVLYRKLKVGKWNETKWTSVKADTDFSVQFVLSALSPACNYEIQVEARSIGSLVISEKMKGNFRTPADAQKNTDVHFMVTTCHEYDHQDAPENGGFKIYPHMLKLDPDFLVHTGDVVYYDQKAKTIPLAFWHWQRMFGLKNNVEFYRQVPTYFMKDDHDTWMNDCFPQMKTQFMGDLTFNKGVEIFKQQTPYGTSPYRTFRWGKHVQVWLTEGRENRNSNDIPDGPNKTIWGKEQMNWFKQTLDASDATFKIVISPTPIIGPDRIQKKDNHANSGFMYEGNQIREFLTGRKNLYVICGDRHWQYVSKHQTNGLMEFSCGPASDEHAGGWKKEDILQEHRYLNIVGGFLDVQVNNSTVGAEIIFKHYSVDGDVLHVERILDKS